MPWGWQSNSEASDESGRKIGDSSQGSVGDPELFDFQRAPNGKGLQDGPERPLRKTFVADIIDTPYYQAYLLPSNV